MSVIAFPYGVGPAKISFGLSRHVMVNESPLSEKVQRVTWGVPVWKATLQWAPMQKREAQLFWAFYEQLSRGDASVYVEPFLDKTGDTPTTEVYSNGLFAAPDLLTNGGFQDTVTGWSNRASGVLSWNARRLRVQNGASSKGQGYQTIATAAGSLPYALVADLVGDQWANSWRMAGLSAGSALGTPRDVTFTATERGILLISNAETAIDTVLGVGVTTSGAIAQFANASFARCLTVNGASQTGIKIAVAGGPQVAAANVLRTGDFVSICTSASVNSTTPKYELKRLTEDLKVGTIASTTSGQGSLTFVPPLRTSPANGAAIVVNRAFCKMTLPKQRSEGIADGPNKQGFTMELVEDIS